MQSAIRGRKDKNYKVPGYVSHLWHGRLENKPSYNDLALFIRFAIENRRITYKALYLLTWSVLNEHQPSVAAGHTEFWKKYAGIKSQYDSGLKSDSIFMIINSQKKVLVSSWLQELKKSNNS